MIRAFLPDLYVNSVYDIDYDNLIDSGYKLIIFDIDNTLKPYDEGIPRSESIKLIKMLIDKGVNVGFVSNGRTKRVKKFASDIEMEIEFIPQAFKPFPRAINKMKKRFSAESCQTCIVGDQIFTDVVAGKLAGIRTILVDPISPKNKFSEKFKRGLEKRILRCYNK